MTGTDLSELHAAVARVVQVWSQGKYFSCSFDVSANGKLLMRFAVTTVQSAADDPDFCLRTHTNEEIAHLLEQSQKRAKKRHADEGDPDDTDLYHPDPE